MSVYSPTVDLGRDKPLPQGVNASAQGDWVQSLTKPWWVEGWRTTRGSQPAGLCALSRGIYALRASHHARILKLASTTTQNLCIMVLST